MKAYTTANRCSVVTLDMAGTTISDRGVVLEAFGASLEDVGMVAGDGRYEVAMAIAASTMGCSKIDVFRRLLAEVPGGPPRDLEGTAQAANEAFESHYSRFLSAGRVEPIPGAVRVMTALKDAGISVCLVTGFSPRTRDAVIRSLGWDGLADLALSPGEAGRGRPWPDLPLQALVRLGGGSVAELAVVGDTPADIESGLRAGAGFVAGVLTGFSQAKDLFASGASQVLSSVADLPCALGL